MIKKAELRPAFVYLSKECGKTFQDIAEFFEITRQTVSNAVNRFDETESNKNRSGSGRKRTVRRILEQLDISTRRSPVTYEHEC
jgi:transposase